MFQDSLRNIVIVDLTKIMPDLVTWEGKVNYRKKHVENITIPHAS